MAYKITLITPVYNARDTLRAAFASVEAQSIGFENIQYILSDDCSSDGSRGLIESWADEYPNVRAIYNEENSGNAGAPRNAALPLAEAPYVMFLDSDDALEPYACELLYSRIEASGADIASGDVKEVFESGSGEEGYIVQFKELSEGVYDLAEPSCELCLSLCFNFWSKIYRRSVIEQNNIRFGASKGWADLLFLYSFLVCARSAEIVRRDVIRYLVSESSMSHKRTADFYKSIPRSIESGFEWGAQRGADGRFAKLLENMRVADYYTNALLDEDFDEAETRDILAAWRGVFGEVYSRSLETDSAVTKILARDLYSDDIDKACFDLAALRELTCQRKVELEGIFSSRTWKLASAMQRLLRGNKT